MHNGPQPCKQHLPPLSRLCKCKETTCCYACIVQLLTMFTIIGSGYNNRVHQSPTLAEETKTEYKAGERRG